MAQGVSFTSDAKHGRPSGGRWLYVGYLIVTSTLIYLVGFITTALGVVVMMLALAGFAAHAVAAASRVDVEESPASSGGSTDPELFRWREVGISVLACLPALFVPSELTSPMASTVFFLIFAVPSYGAAFGWHAWSRWHNRRKAVGRTMMPEVGVAPPPPGWYGDPADVRFLRWWDGWQWTLYVQPRPW